MVNGGLLIVRITITFALLFIVILCSLPFRFSLCIFVAGKLYCGIDPRDKIFYFITETKLVINKLFCICNFVLILPSGSKKVLPSSAERKQTKKRKEAMQRRSCKIGYFETFPYWIVSRLWDWIEPGVSIAGARPDSSSRPFAGFR